MQVFPTAMSPSALIYMTITVVMIQQHSTSAAPLISKNQDQNENITNPIEDSESLHVKGHGTYKYSLLEDGLFEGDIQISEEEIRLYYNLSSISGGEKYYEMMSDEEESSQRNGTGMSAREGEKKVIHKRAATSGYLSNHQLWVNAIVPYMFARNVSNGVRHSIRKAMDYWEDNTCVRFKAHRSESDYVEFVRETSGCWSNVGRRGGRQALNWNKDYKCDFGTMLHELGHAIGFWHEQSRPDRDQYIRVLNQNIAPDKRDEFVKQRSSEINSLGSEYDYASVMHYPTNKFVRSGCSGCKAFEVTNDWAYRAQDSPRIGNWNGNRLSVRDIQQANSLYGCSAKRGVQGLFFVRVKIGRNLPDTDPWHNSPDPYIKITAVDSYGSKYIKNTRVISGTTNPNWNEELVFYDFEWKFFRIQAWDSDSFFTGGDDKMSVSETIVISGGEHQNTLHCIDNCFGFVGFDYGIYDLTSARLSVFIRFAFNVQDTDGRNNDPDPYVVVRAVSSNGPYIQQTHAEDGTRYPLWYSNLDFGCQRWANFIEIQMWDSDSGSGDDEMSDKEKVTLSVGHHFSNLHPAYGGANLNYDYDFIPC